MYKKIINKILTDIISKNNTTVKCGRTYLDKKDKALITAFHENHDDYVDVGRGLRGRRLRDELWELYESHEYTRKEDNALDYWKGEGYDYINGKIYQTKEYLASIENGLLDEQYINEKSKLLQKSIDNSPKLPFSVITERIGHWEKGLNEGDVVVQKGFASTSLISGSDLGHNTKPYKIKYYIPGGSKAYVYPDDILEKELLLGRNTRQYVLNQDDNNHTVEVLILPDR